MLISNEYFVWLWWHHKYFDRAVPSHIDIQMAPSNARNFIQDRGTTVRMNLSS